MLNRKGYSLLELLVVLLILLALILFFFLNTIGQINEARGSTLMSEARMVYIVAESVLVEDKSNGGTDDYDIIRGLTGTVDDASLPAQTRLSQRMNALLAPDVVLAKEPSEGMGRVTFEVKDGIILSMAYEAMIGKRLYVVTMEDGEAAVTQVK